MVHCFRSHFSFVHHNSAIGNLDIKDRVAHYAEVIHHMERLGYTPEQMTEGKGCSPGFPKPCAPT